MEKYYFGMKATRINDIITFENGEAYDLNQPIDGDCCKEVVPENSTTEDYETRTP